jgi:ergothioneine biosynthesis protein EgtB
MADASPPKWHLAHTSWFFETFLLKPFAPRYREFHPQFEHLFNSYYNGVGEPFPRARRGHLSRPTVAEVLDYRRHVDSAMMALLARAEASEPGASETDVCFRVTLGLNHEQQHQELLLTDLKYNFGHNPLLPPYREPAAPADTVASRDQADLSFTAHPGGIVEIGVAADGAFAFDNETPRHRVYLEPFALADRLVTSAEYLAFMADGGYRTPSLWLSDGWAWVAASGVSAPLYWHERDGQWFEYRLDGSTAVVGTDPVTHVSAYEADAFARWAGCRLPSEAEWEVQAALDSRAGNFVESGRLHPGPAGSGRQLFGDAWEWTASAYAPYPGYRALDGTLGEYNGKFMSNQLVLRGGSCVTPGDHIRPSYRNFFYPPDRWQFTGIRLARDGH